MTAKFDQGISEDAKFATETQPFTEADLDGGGGGVFLNYNIFFINFLSANCKTMDCLGTHLSVVQQSE